MTQIKAAAVSVELEIPSGASTTVAPATTAAPVKGGTITVGQYSRENGLDPTKLNGGGTVGGSELAALYDTLMRYNPETGAFPPYAYTRIRGAIVDGLRKRGERLAVTDIAAVTSRDYPAGAPRPHNSRLDMARLQAVFGLGIAIQNLLLLPGAPRKG